MFRKVVSVVTLVLLAIVIFAARAEILDAFNFLSEANIWVILLLIPEQFFMYYCCGQMFFSYLIARNKTSAKKIKAWSLVRISFELNFVNNAIPSGGVSGLGYMTWRLLPYGASAGQTSFMYLLRYIITVIANQAQTIIAIVVLALAGEILPGTGWVFALVSAVCAGVIAVIVMLIVIAREESRINKFASALTKFVNGLVGRITFGHKPEILKPDLLRTYFLDIHKDLVAAGRNRRILNKPVVWGVIYSFLEVATYWIVGMSMGHPELLPQIMVAEAIASIIGAVLVTPGGIGGYEGAMIFVMSALGVDIGLATAIVVTTRIVVLLGTVASGYGFYQHAIATAGKGNGPHE